MVVLPCKPSFLDDHLCNALSTKRLAALELLALETSKRIEDCSKHQEDGCDNQACGHGPDADPLYGAHHKVDGSAHVVGAKLADEFVEFRRGWADAEEKRYFNEYDDEGAYPTTLVRLETPCDRSEEVVQAYDAECDDKVGVEDVGDAQRKAQEYA
jgi:hypothetical protein